MIKINITENNAENVLIALEGELDTLAAQQFAKEMQPVIDSINSQNADEGGRIITLDFTQLEYISSAGLRTILLMQKTAQAKCGKVSIKGMSENIKQIFQMTGFDQMIEIL